MRSIIVDDEAAARRSLQTLLEKFCEDVEIVGTASNVPDAVKLIEQTKPDLVFLDIEMPEYSGFELLDFFDKIDFQIIFVTAYQEFALKAFEVSALDYLTKPVRIKSLRRAISKMQNFATAPPIKERIEVMQTNLKAQKPEKIALPTSDGLLFVNTKDIVALEAEGSYTSFHLSEGKPVVVSKRIGHFDALTDSDNFLRTHRSFVINTHHLLTYSRNESSIKMDNGLSVRVARDRKKEFEDMMVGLGF
jgi:two-component system LytT family response regulator